MILVPHPPARYFLNQVELLTMGGLECVCMGGGRWGVTGVGVRGLHKMWWWGGSELIILILVFGFDFYIDSN